MAFGIIGRKRGMTRIFDAEGRAVPVTVIEASPNRITRLVDQARQGYRAVQVTWGSKKPARLNRAAAGIFAAGGIAGCAAQAAASASRPCATGSSTRASNERTPAYQLGNCFA